MTYRGPAAAIDPRDPEPFDAVCVRPDPYDEALVRMDDHLTAVVAEINALTPWEADLRRFGEVVARGRDRYIRARRTRAVQLTFPFYAQTSPRV